MKFGELVPKCLNGAHHLNSHHKNETGVTWKQSTVSEGRLKYLTYLQRRYVVCNQRKLISAVIRSWQRFVVQSAGQAQLIGAGIPPRNIPVS